MTHRITAVAVGAIALLAALAPAAGAATAQQTIASLNAQRATNGLPAGITENPTWSADCQKHDEYMAMNGDTLTHSEVMGDRGYSAGGAFAGANAVLSAGSWDAGNPYERAPLHLDQLLAPRLNVLGTADVDGFSCTTTFPGWTRPAPAAATVYTYPGNGATIYPSEVARELPFTPGSLVGLKPTAKTGPNLFVFVDAPGQNATDNPATLSSITLSGPSGTVSVDHVDGNTAVPGGRTASCPSGTLSCYIAPGGLIIPAKPLAAGTTYHVHVVVGFAGSQSPHSWTFTTLGLDPHSNLTLTGKVLAFRSRSPAPIKVRFTRASGAPAPSRLIAPGHRIHLNDLAPGSWQACGTQNERGHYAGFSECVSILVTGIPKLAFGTPHQHGHTVAFPITYSSVLRGRPATLTVTPLTVSCLHGHHDCTTTAGTPSGRTLVLRSHKLVLVRPAKGQGYELALATTAFQLKDAPWTAAHAVSSPYVRR